MKHAFIPQKYSGNLLPVMLILIFAVQCIVYIPTLNTWLDEGIYLMKSWWYVTGQIQPYSSQDNTQYMPLYFYLLGYWQLLFGKGHLSGRILSSLLATGTLYILYRSGKNIWKEKNVGIFSVVLMLFSPFAIKLYCTATQYSPVALLNLIVFFLITQQHRIHPVISSILLGAGYCGLYFFRPNMIAGIILYFVYQISINPKKRLIRSIITIGTASGISAILFLIFGRFLMMYSFSLPIVMPILSKVFPDSWFGFFTYLIGPSVKVYQTLGYSVECFTKNFLIFYAFILVPCISALINAIRKATVLQPEAFASGYFVVMVLFNFLGSQSYEPAIIKHYTAYFLPVGILAASVEYFRLYNEFLRAGKKPVLFFIISLLIIIAGLYSFFAVIRQVNRAHNNESDFSKIKTLSQQIKAHIPPDSPVLILGDNYLIAQTLFLCDLVPEVATINYSYSHQHLRSSISSTLKNHLEEELKKRSFWDDEIMLDWIRNKHDYILFCHEPSTMHWYSEVNKFYRPVVQLSKSIDSCTLYMRNQLLLQRQNTKIE